MRRKEEVFITFILSSAISFSVVVLITSGINRSSSHGYSRTFKEEEENRIHLICRDLIGPQISPNIHGFRGSELLPVANKYCPRYVHIPFKAKAGLGHRISNWLMITAASSAFSLSPTLGSDFNNCSKHAWHGCYTGAGETLGLYDENTIKIEALFKDYSKQHKANHLHWKPPTTTTTPQNLNLNSKPTLFDSNVNGLGWGVISLWNQSAGSLECKTIHKMNEAWFRDLSFGRWLLAYLMEKQHVSEMKAAQAQPLNIYEADSVAVAIHLRYGNDTEPERRKVVNEEWLKAIMNQITHIAQEQHAPLRFYAFTGGSAWPWIIKRADTTIIDSKIMPQAADVIKQLSLADILVCGPSSLCLASAWATTRSLTFTAYGRENFGKGREFTTCPSGIECVPESGYFSFVSRSRLQDILGRWKLRRSLGCPPVWEIPFV